VQEDTALVQADRAALAAWKVTPATFKGGGPAVEIRGEDDGGCGGYPLARRDAPDGK
jgi:hypothetical protein